MKNNVFKIIFGAIVSTIGILSIVFAFKVLSRLSDGCYIAHKYYGGDAYTGIQNAAADTGNNVSDLAQICQKGFGYLLVIIGLFLLIAGLACVVFSIINISDKKKENRNAAIAQNNLPYGYSERNNDVNPMM